MWFTQMVLTGALAALAWGVVRARPAHHAIALFLSATVIADATRRALALFILAPARAELDAAPYAGLVRVAFHADQALFLAWPAGLAALALSLLARRSVRPIVIAYAAVAASLAFAYPAVRGPLLARCYAAAELLALAVVASAGLAWWRRRERPTITEGSVLVIACVELGAVIAYRAPFGLGWSVAQVFAIIAYGALIIVHLGESWTSSRPRTSR